MSRPLRIEYPGAWHHVMNRGRGVEEIFTEANDYRLFLDLLQDSCELWNVKISAYCLMPRHYHLLIQTPEGNLSRCMRHINGVYTQRFNRAHHCDGQLFRGRFKSILVDGDSYLLQLVRYIHEKGDVGSETIFRPDKSVVLLETDLNRTFLLVQHISS